MTHLRMIEDEIGHDNNIKAARIRRPLLNLKNRFECLPPYVSLVLDLNDCHEKNGTESLTMTCVLRLVDDTLFSTLCRRLSNNGSSG